MSQYEIIRPTQETALQRVWRSLRSITLGPYNPRDREIAKYFGGAPSSSGIPVNEHTALNYSAVWAAVSLISGDVAALPLKLYRRLPNGGKEPYVDHPLYRLLHEAPNPDMPSMQFRQMLQAHALTWGSGYAEIERYNRQAIALWPITPDRVTPLRGSNGELVYRVANAGGDVFVDPKNMLHIRGLGYSETEAYSPIRKARESIGLGMAAERFGSTFFGNGSTFGGVFSSPKAMTDPQVKNWRDSVNARHQGVDRAHKYLLVQDGMTFTETGIPPNEAQFLETRQFQVAEIARWFNVPPHKIGDLSRATFSNIEQQNIEYFQTTLVHWLKAWEEELMFKLISPLERKQQLVEHVTQGLLRGDAAGRSEYYSKLFMIGGITVNEIRALENLNPVDGGDTPMVPLNMVPLDKLDEMLKSQMEANKPAPAPAPAEPMDEDERAALKAQVTALADRLDAAHASLTEARADLGRERQAHADTTQARTHAEQRIRDLEIVVQTAEAATTVADASRARVQQERDEALAAQVHLAELLDGATTSLAAEKAERAREVGESQQQIHALTEQRDAATQKSQALTDEANELNRLLIDRDGQIEAMTGEHREALAKRDQALESRDANVAVLAKEKDEADQRATVAEAQAREAAAQHAATIEALQGTLTETQARIAALETDLSVAHKAREQADAKSIATGETLAVVLAERDAWQAQHEADHAAHEAVIAETRARVAALETDLSVAHQAREQADADLAEGRKLCESVQAQRDEWQEKHDAVEAAKEQADAALKAQREAERQRMVGVIAAHRALVADVMTRMVEREAEKARRNHGTPEKLRKWSETFYTLHEETCVEALLPTMRAHLAWLQSDDDPEMRTRQLVRAHIRESIAHIRAVADSDPDEYPVLLERTLQRWTTERPAALADAVQKEAIDSVSRS